MYNLSIPEQYQNPNEKQRLKLKKFTQEITSAGQEVDMVNNLKFDSITKFVYGFQITSNNTAQARERGWFSLKLNDREVYSYNNKVPAKMFISGEECPVNDRMFELNLPILQSNWECNFEDENNPYLIFQPYTIVLLLYVYDEV